MWITLEEIVTVVLHRYQSSSQYYIWSSSLAAESLEHGPDHI